MHVVFSRFPFSGTSNMLFFLYFSVARILYSTLRWVVTLSLFQKRKLFFARVLPPKPSIQDGATLHKYSASFRLTYLRIVNEKNQFASVFNLKSVDFVLK